MHGGPGDGGLRGETPTATASSAPGPVGYLVNHPAGLAGAHGIGYDYVLGCGRSLRPVRERPPDGASVTVASCDGAGPGSRDREGGACPRPHPVAALRGGAALVPGRPRHRAVLRRAVGRASLPAGGSRPQEGTASSLTYTPPAGVVAEFHSHGTSRAFFSKPPTTGTSRASASTASWDASTARLPELSLRVGVYGHFAPLEWSQVFDWPGPGRPAHGRTRHTKRMTRR